MGTKNNKYMKARMKRGRDDCQEVDQIIVVVVTMRIKVSHTRNGQ